MAEGRKRENYLGIKGWVRAGRYGLERYLYFLQRLTGFGLIIYLLIHLYETSFRLRGEVTWEGVMGLFDQPVFAVLEYVVMAAFIFHALNGLRLVIEELGFALGKPRRPVYPYETSLQRQRPFMWAIGVLIIVFLVVSLYDFLV